ncbi:hypothetical protein [Paenibacillus arenilitoris]|uniref:Uncharacterized protein n=1 Tax=Paenibacillus arenilitoris TaxID=2772299 RepID=A0A927CJD8_9BACL|nr:hypothetical protein [Paenibacillus arenilitoris]MBD2869174.1 hypothetical protein [Paenibacillus arenilitoris]
MKWKKASYIGALAAVVVLLALWRVGYIGLWTEGMAYIANNTDKYKDTNGHLVDGQYAVSIDLSDLQSNVGKELYNDGIHRVYVSWIDNTGSMNSGGYRIGFRSDGRYGITGASLISGVHHARVNGHSFTMTMTARMAAQYKGKSFTSSEFGVSGINYRDGDDFGFYIFPYDAYESQEVSLDESGVVELIVTELYKNVWSENAAEGSSAMAWDEEH